MAASYRVTAPYVTLKVKDAAGADVLVGFYEGAVVTDVDADSLQHHLDDGMVEKLPASEAKAAAGLGTDPDPDEGVSDGPPAKSAAKSDWEDYARSQGASEEDLDGQTKDDLVAKYGA